MQAVQLAAVLALLVSCAAGTTGTMCDKWAQCGGKGSMCGQKGYGTCEDAAWSTHTCPSNFECQRQSDYYWQCLPVGSSQPQNAPKDSKHHDTVKGGVLAQWEQCGGTAGVCGIGSYGPCRDDAWSEPVCPSGFECVRDTQYYWQCLPMDRAPPASPAPSEMSGGEEMPNGVVPQWGQCGGQAGTCGADGWGPCEDKVWDSPVCPDGFTCERQSQWYYQCLPDNATDVVSSPRVSGGHQTTVHNGIIIEWGQCGGVAGVCGQDKQGPCQDSAWSSPVCPTDFECVRDTQYYWQCLPKDRSPSPSPSASPAPPMEESSMEESSSMEMSPEMSPSGPGDYVPQYGQCGGTSGVCGMPGWGPCEDKTWDSPMCPSGFTCTRQTQYYWQCLPVEQSNGGEMSMEESSGFELSMEESSSEANPSGVVPPWGQCGGKSGVCGQPGWGPCKDAVWDSPVCPPGFSCTRDTKWYYQCLPEEGTQPEKSVQGGNQQYDNRVKNGVLAQWEQCGGTSGVCGNTTAGFGPCQDSAWSSPTCPSSYECRRQSEWYWQCVPVGWSAPSPVSSEASQQYKPVNGMLRGWDQCGGMSSMCGQDGWGACVDEAWDKPMCPDGFKCKRDTKWYWQCLPTNAPSPSKTPSPVKSVQQPVNGECPKWAQCGGMGGVCGQSGWGPCQDKVWDSPKCPSGFTCTKDTKWYYQCLPEGTKLSKKHN